MGYKKNRSGRNTGAPAGDRLDECEMMLLTGMDFDRTEWKREVEWLAREYPEEFGWALEASEEEAEASEGE